MQNFDKSARFASIAMGSISLDGTIVSIGQSFKCPGCNVFKKTMDFLTRVKGGEFKLSDIICNQCFDERVKNEKIALANKLLAKNKIWKWVHTSKCPVVLEHGGGQNLQRYCLKCLNRVLVKSNSDWDKYLYVDKVLKIENLKIRSLQDYCIREIIEKNVQFSQLPRILKNRIQHTKKKRK